MSPTTIQFLQITFYVLGSIASIYLVFFKSYYARKGSNAADKEDLEEITKGIETIKASVSKENITHQIYTAEYVRMRFQKLDNLHTKLYELKKFCEAKFALPHDENSFDKVVDEFDKIYGEAEDSLSRAIIYVNVTLGNAIGDFLRKCRRIRHDSGSSNLFPVIADKHRATGDVSHLNKLGKEAYGRLMDSIPDLSKILEDVENVMKEHFVK